MDANAWIMHGCECMGNAWLCVLVDNKMDNTYCMDNAWTMYGYVLVDNKINNNTWVMFYDYDLVDNKISDISLAMFLWVTRWLLLHWLYSCGQQDG